MIFITKDEIAALPEDPEEAFVELEELVRHRYIHAYDALREDESVFPLLHRYMSIVLPASKHYRIAALAGWDRPDEKQSNRRDHYEGFMDDVDYCVSALKLQIVGSVRQHSVALDAAAKSKLRHLLSSIRETVDQLDVSAAKKDRLYACISALHDEIDRDRTRYQAVAALLIEACDDIGEAAKRLEPVVRLVERIGAAVGIAKRFEDEKPKLPSRRPPKRIENGTNLAEHGQKRTARREVSFDDSSPF
ncbi:hypothetical protein ACO2I3_02435 [Leptospira interrogans]